MGKITVKHYLNTNLKPYIINGEKYFTIYALVTANRQNTKVKSKVFNEYYTENDFIEITDENNKEDFITLQNEAKTIENIANELINKVEIFDTALFSAIYNYFQEIFIYDLDIQVYKEGNTVVDLYDKNKNKLGIAIDQFFIKEFSMKESRAKGMSLFTWFSPLGQTELEKFLFESNCKFDIKEAKLILNDIVFEKSFEVLSWILKGSQKYKILLDKYDHLFESVYKSASYEKIGIEK
ncbi:hypothetical protein FACS1894203_0340 [Bacteroidia bacterium]|nr:hypothetical protein FACS1894203_0340 [Bacteroidia bacterium]